MKIEEILDISRPIPPPPGDFGADSFDVQWMYRFEADGANSEAIRMNLHLCTHVDAPFHYFGDGTTVDRMPLDRFQGEAVVVRVPKGVGEMILREDLAGYEDAIGEGKIVLFDTGWGRKTLDESSFYDVPGVSRECAEWLVSKKIKGVGIDHFSVSGFQRDYVRENDCHPALLGNGIWVLEGAVFPEEGVEPEGWYFFGFPLFFKGLSGSPVRAVLIKFGE